MMPDPLTPRDALGVTVLRTARISDAIAPLFTGRPPTGRVVGVHRRGIDLRVGSRLVALTTRSVGALPFGIALTGEPDLRRAGIEPGASVAVVGSRLRFQWPGPEIELATAAAWSPRLGPASIDPADLAWRARAIRSAAAALAPPAGFGPLLARLPGWTAGDATSLPIRRLAQPALAGLVAALERDEAEAAVAHAGDLIGLGIGSTPSGDDLVVGLTATLVATGHPAARTFGAGCAALAPGRTTGLAEAFLRHAGRAEFSERIHGLLRAVLGAEPGALPAAVAAALGWGATSGADCLLGVVLGLEVAARPGRAVA